MILFEFALNGVLALSILELGQTQTRGPYLYKDHKPAVLTQASFPDICNTYIYIQSSKSHKLTRISAMSLSSKVMPMMNPCLSRHFQPFRTVLARECRIYIYIKGVSTTRTLDSLKREYRLYTFKTGSCANICDKNLVICLDSMHSYNTCDRNGHYRATLLETEGYIRIMDAPGKSTESQNGTLKLSCRRILR